MNLPYLTILMPAYNTEPFIGEAIHSVLAQEYQDYELLIIDDGSTDRTLDIIHSCQDDRIRVITQLHQGICVALNRGLAEARGQYIARFDADDICLPGRLSRQVEFLDAHPSYVICGGNAEYISETGEHLFHYRCPAYEHEDIMQVLYTHCPFIHSAVMYRRDAVCMAGGYPLEAHNFEDYLLWTRLSAFGFYHNLQEPLIKVRFNPASVTMDEKWRGRRFRDLKQKILRQGFVTADQARSLEFIIRRQNKTRYRKAAYYALCGKKFLVDNHQPRKARTHLGKAIRLHPFRWDNYALFILSFFPKSVIGWLHRNKSFQLVPR